LFLYVLAWLVIGVGVLGAAPRVIKLTAGRARLQMAEPGARRKAWSELAQSLTPVAFGLFFLATAVPSAEPFRWPAGALVFAFVGWGVVPSIRSGKRRRSDGVAGEAGSGPAASASGEQPSARTASLPDVSASGAELAEWVDRTTFSTTRLRPGYAQEDVDVFLDRISDAFLHADVVALTSDDVRDIRFATTLWRPGYDEEDVDKFLDIVQVRLPIRSRG
jgi:DivIVA domain-containing protein